MNRYLSLGLLLLIAICATADEKNSKGIELFEKRIRPILIKKCYACHSQEAAKNRKLKGKLLLDSKTGIRKGGESGLAIIPGNGKEGLLMEAIQHNGLEMPPNEKLPEQVIADFRNWIQLGAPDPRTGQSIDARKLQLAEGRKYWAYQRLPSAKHKRTPVTVGAKKIDSFIEVKLKERNFTATGKADKSTLLRRAYFDLTGLPPTPEAFLSFQRDGSEKAYEKLIDKLLKSQHFGERWGRHWLDVVRFGETVGSNPEEDKPRKNAYKFRDAVIRALNSDVPFNKFVQAHFTGTLSGKKSELGKFVELGTRLQKNAHPNDKKLHILDDIVSATGSAFLAMTIGCARCHDHKLDPVTAEEYYRLSAVFFDLAKVDPRVGANTVRVIDKPRVLIGGSWQNPAAVVQAGFVEVLMRDGSQSSTWLEPSEGQPRRALANWLIDANIGAGSLLARVIVNRLWQHHFGRGIVATPNDFGQLSESPSHPELLDFLAAELIRGEWRLKRIHKMIMLTDAYRRDARSIGMNSAKLDQDNKWLWHYRPRRLEAEVIRDSILSAAGAINLEMFGPSIDVGDYKRTYVDKPADWRRSIYLLASRFQTHPVTGIFDPAGTFRSQGSRVVSTTPRSALFAFNSKFLWDQADRFASRVKREVGSDTKVQIQHIYRITFSREPLPEELQLGTQLLTGDKEQSGGKGRLVRYCHAILGLNEFIYIR